jgi:hypothetical protein
MCKIICCIKCNELRPCDRSQPCISKGWKYSESEAVRVVWDKILKTVEARSCRNLWTMENSPDISQLKIHWIIFAISYSTRNCAIISCTKTQSSTVHVLSLFKISFEQRLWWYKYISLTFFLFTEQHEYSKAN